MLVITKARQPWLCRKSRTVSRRPELTKASTGLSFGLYTNGIPRAAQTSATVPREDHEYE